MRAIKFLAVLSLVAIAACGGDDDSDAGPTADQSDDASSDDAAAPSGDEDAAPSGGGRGTATLELTNGEAYEFSILCGLEPQEAAGSEILFTVVSYDDPGLDITQFGDEGTITGMKVITVYDSDYETLWEAGSLYEAFGGSLDLSLEGSSVTGSGSFFPGGDIEAEPVDGIVVANC